MQSVSAYPRYHSSWGKHIATHWRAAKRGAGYLAEKDGGGGIVKTDQERTGACVCTCTGHHVESCSNRYNSKATWVKGPVWNVIRRIIRIIIIKMTTFLSQWFSVCGTGHQWHPYWKPNLLLYSCFPKFPETKMPGLYWRQSSGVGPELPLNNADLLYTFLPNFCFTLSSTNPIYQA